VRLCASVCVCVRLCASVCVCVRLCASVCVCVRGVKFLLPSSPSERRLHVALPHPCFLTSVFAMPKNSEAGVGVPSYTKAYYRYVFPFPSMWLELGFPELLLCRSHMFHRDYLYFACVSSVCASRLHLSVFASFVHGSFTHGNVHVVVLNSFDVSSSSSGPMMTWARADIQSARQSGQVDWVVAMFHHPAYSWGECLPACLQCRSRGDSFLSRARATQHQSG
jgi:hypothetical protein